MNAIGCPIQSHFMQAPVGTKKGASRPSCNWTWDWMGSELDIYAPGGKAGFNSAALKTGQCSMALFDSRAPTVSDRIGFNRRFYAGNLEKVFTPTSDDELVAAVTQASTPEQAGEDPGVRIVSGRHCYENFVFNATSKSLIDCIGLDGVGQHPDRGYFVEAGASNWSSFTRLNALFGKCLPGGSCYSVGIGGHVSGGGYGLLSRLQGLTVDWVTGVDIVLTPAPGKAELHHVDA
ncbi:MAG: FAD-dependent oxidoreductase, partial [Boseongicola sp. SB0670_bin_30]|nr:FAD-dependent oxidoreductase [Boseongicola sp. SB0670_bin_30]